MKLGEFIEKIRRDQGYVAVFFVSMALTITFLSLWFITGYMIVSLGFDIIVGTFTLPFSIGLYFIVKQLIINYRENK